MKKIFMILSSVTLMFVIGCGTGDSINGYTSSNYQCADIPGTQCTNFQSCCNTSKCYFKADGKTFDCNGQDCDDASKKAIAYCSGSDASLGFDIHSGE